ALWQSQSLYLILPGRTALLPAALALNYLAGHARRTRGSCIQSLARRPSDAAASAPPLRTRPADHPRSGGFPRRTAETREYTNVADRCKRWPLPLVVHFACGIAIWGDSGFPIPPRPKPRNGQRCADEAHDRNQLALDK